jgi:hypothetical protein
MVSLYGGTHHRSTTVRAVPRLHMLLHARRMRPCMHDMATRRASPDALHADFWHEPYMGMDLNDWEQACPAA